MNKLDAVAETTKTELKKLGRPNVIDGKRRNVFIDDESWSNAQKLGNGNASEGIRKALELAQTLDSADH